MAAGPWIIEEIDCKGAQRSFGVGGVVDRNILSFERGFPGGSVVKNPPAMQETWV